MTRFLDTSVLMYAAGTEHRLKGACVQIVDGIGDGAIRDVVTSAEVVQEIVHRYLSIGQPEIARDLATRTLDLLAPVLPITHALMRRVPDLAARYPGLAARDLIHIATCIHEGIPEIISADQDLDRVAEVRRIDPLAFRP